MRAQERYQAEQIYRSMSNVHRRCRRTGVTSVDQNGAQLQLKLLHDAADLGHAEHQPGQVQAPRPRGRAMALRPRRPSTAPAELG